MRTLTIALIAAFVFLLSQQLTAAGDRHDREERGASQAVVAGRIGCFVTENSNVEIQTGAGLGVIGVSTLERLAVALDLPEKCSDLISSLAEEVPHRICEIGDQTDPEIVAFGFVCTGRADAVISAIGKMAKAVIRLGQP